MKKICAMALLLSSMSMFVACSHDDDDDNGKGAGNGGSGVEVLAKKVSQIKETYEEGTSTYSNTITFDYDSEGRLSKLIDSDSPDDITTFTYANNKITYVEDGLTSTITLKDGKAEKEEYYLSDDYLSVYTFTYSGDYLAKSEEIGGYKRETGRRDTSITTFTVKDRLLVSSRYSEIFNGKDNYVSVVTYEYSPQINNNTNIDLWLWVTNGELGNYVNVLCVSGKRFANLPTKIIDKRENGELRDSETVDYVVDKEGYITKIIVNDGEKGVVRTLEISYQ